MYVWLFVFVYLLLFSLKYKNFWINPELSSVEQQKKKEGEKETEEESETQAEPMLYGINIVRNKADSSVRRGAVVKSIALFSRYHYTQVYIYVYVYKPAQLKKTIKIPSRRYHQLPNYPINHIY